MELCSALYCLTAPLYDKNIYIYKRNSDPGFLGFTLFFHCFSLAFPAQSKKCPDPGRNLHIYHHAAEPYEATKGPYCPLINSPAPCDICMPARKCASQQNAVLILSSASEIGRVSPTSGMSTTAALEFEGNSDSGAYRKSHKISVKQTVSSYSDLDGGF